MIRIHHLNQSRSRRVIWLLEELGLPYEVVRYQRDFQTMLAPPELLKIHPLGKSPVIEDMDDMVAGQGRIIAETGAIIEYLVEKAGGKLGAPADRENALSYRYWLHYAEGSAMPPLVFKLVASKVSPNDAQLNGLIDHFLTPQLDFIEAELGKSPWFAGDALTAADVIMSFPVEAASGRADMDRYPNMLAFLNRIQARPAYVRAVAAGGL